MALSNWREAYRRYSPITQIVIAQLVAIFIIASVLTAVAWVYAYSTLLGGLCAILPGVAAHWRSQRPQPPGQSPIAPVLRGEIWKFAVSVLLFMLVFSQVQPLSIGFFFGSFLVAQLCYALVPLIEAKRLRRQGAKATTP